MSRGTQKKVKNGGNKMNPNDKVEWKDLLRELRIDNLAKIAAAFLRLAFAIFVLILCVMVFRCSVGL